MQRHPLNTLPLKKKLLVKSTLKVSVYVRTCCEKTKQNQKIDNENKLTNTTSIVGQKVVSLRHLRKRIEITRGE